MLSGWLPGGLGFDLQLANGRYVLSAIMSLSPTVWQTDTYYLDVTYTDSFFGVTFSGFAANGTYVPGGTVSCPTSSACNVSYTMTLPGGHQMPFHVTNPSAPSIACPPAFTYVQFKSTVPYSAMPFLASPYSDDWASVTSHAGAGTGFVSSDATNLYVFGRRARGCICDFACCC